MIAPDGRNARASDERGSAAVDFALIAPLLVSLAVGVVSLVGWVVAVAHTHRALDAAVAEAARRPHSDAAAPRVVRARVAGELPGQPVRAVVADEVIVARSPVTLAVLGWPTPVSIEVASRAPREPA